MADVIVTIASGFRVRHLHSFLTLPEIIQLRRHFVESENSPTREAGYFHTREHPDGSGVVSFGGYCGMPDGLAWKEAIREHISQDAPMRISMAGFDAALKYTVAAAYDISSSAITPVDASYGSILGSEWFSTLPEIHDARDTFRDVSGPAAHADP